jgi:hypothetical protein
MSPIYLEREKDQRQGDKQPEWQQWKDSSKKQNILRRRGTRSKKPSILLKTLQPSLEYDTVP